MGASFYQRIAFSAIIGAASLVGAGVAPVNAQGQSAERQQERQQRREQRQAERSARRQSQPQAQQPAQPQAWAALVVAGSLARQVQACGVRLEQAADAAAYIADRVNVAAADAEVDVRLFATSSSWSRETTSTRRSSTSTSAFR